MTEMPCQPALRSICRSLVRPLDRTGHHAATLEGPGILNALFAALHNLDRDLGGKYADMVRAALPREVWDHLEEHLKSETYEYLSEWARENIAKGKVEGRAQAIPRPEASRCPRAFPKNPEMQ
ncbi:hypothetical protein [Microbispora bryophytorum]|uniref:hypothetical protein n=1 Tax=Microbispora bryophytorum TaxID=1460882 RepID=UPI0033EFA3DA